MNPDFSAPKSPNPHVLPRLYVITDPASAQSGAGDVISAVKKSSQAGARFFQFRDKQADLPELLSTAQALTRALKQTNSILLVNNHVDLALTLNCHGVHRPGHGPAIPKLRQKLGNTAIIGVSTHSLTEALQAEQAGANFVTISPIFTTPSKPGYGPILGLDSLHQVASALKIPVYALGGISPDNTLDCLKAGAHGVAVMGGIMAAADPAQATRKYLRVINAFDATSSEYPR